jgi:di/tricarboxylate transporter
MNTEQWILILIVLLPLALVFRNKMRLDLAALSMAAALGVGQLLGLGLLGPPGDGDEAIRAISGFSQPVVFTLIGLFILTSGLERSGITRWIAHRLVSLAGSSEANMIALFATVTASLSLFMNNLAAGALLLPSAMEVARATKVKPSRLLIPVAYGSMLGGAATYFTTANIIMSDLLRIATPPQEPLHILDFAPTGVLIVGAGILFFWLFGRIVLPERAPSPEQAMARRTGSELEDLYQLGERLWQAQVQSGSVLIGRAVAQSTIGSQWGITIGAIRRGLGEFLLPRATQTLRLGDTLLLIGREDKISQLSPLGLAIQPAHADGHLSQQGITFSEVLPAPHSSIVGKTLKEIEFRQRTGLTAVALKRLNRSFRTDVGDLPIQFGDSLLVIGPVNATRTLRNDIDWIVIEPNPGDQPVNLRMALISTGVTAGAIAASLAGAPVYLSMMVGAILAVILRVIPMEEAYQKVEWQAIFLIAGMYAVSLAMVQTGLAALVGNNVLALVTPLGPLGLAGGAYLLTAILTQFMGGQVAALITGPIMISAAIQMGANPQAIAVATATGCSTAFLTPMTHPVNLLMIAPGNYRFSDFFRAGWPLTLLSFAMLLLGLVLFWNI